MLYDPNIAARIEASDSASSSKFAEIVVAIGDFIHGQKIQWRIGDLLIEYCGPPGENGVRNGFTKKANRIIEELKKIHGKYVEVDFSYLEQWRLFAHRFPPPKRLGAIGVGWSLHQAAKYPDNLRKAIAEPKRQGRPLTLRFVKEFVASLNADPDVPHWKPQKEEWRRLAARKPPWPSS
jgi:hypothetical protein